MTHEKTDDWFTTLTGEIGVKARRKLRPMGRDRAVLAETTVIAEGARADNLHLVIDGEVEVEVDGLVVSRLGDGEFFGEVVLLYAPPGGPGHPPASLPRAATVKATRATRLRELSR